MKAGIINIMGMLLLIEAQGTAVNSTRALKSMTEVKDMNAPMPDVFHAKVFSTEKLSDKETCVDLFSKGACEFIEGENLNIDMTGRGIIPSLFTLDSSRNIVFAEPKPAAAIRSKKGRNICMHITLNEVAGACSAARNYVLLGIRKQGEKDFLDRLYIPETEIEEKKHASTYIDISDEDTIEILPLLSITNMKDTYTPAVIGEAVDEQEGFPEHLKTFNISSVFKLKADITSSSWTKRGMQSNLSEACPGWIGEAGAGFTKPSWMLSGNNYLMLAVNSDGRLVSSSNGTFWEDVRNNIGNKQWTAGPVYGNGMWCAIGNDGAKYSNNAESWNDINDEDVKGCNRLTYGGEMFMASKPNPSDGTNRFYCAKNVQSWLYMGYVPESFIGVLGHIGGKWICGGEEGRIYWLDEYAKSWNLSAPAEGFSLNAISSGDWLGGCYAYDYIYAVSKTEGIIARSKDGKDWTKVTQLEGSDEYSSITFYKNKLYVQTKSGTIFYTGLFTPEGVMYPDK